MIALVSPWLAAIARNAGAERLAAGQAERRVRRAAASCSRRARRGSAGRSRGTASPPAAPRRPASRAGRSARPRAGSRSRRRARRSSSRRPAAARGSIGISSSFASPITAAPCFATIGRIASSRSSSPVTELTSALPWYAREPGLERLDHRRVDAERHVGQALDERDRLPHQLDLVGERVADVHVEHVGAACDLLRDVDLDPRQVAAAAAPPGTPCGRSG